MPSSNRLACAARLAICALVALPASAMAREAAPGTPDTVRVVVASAPYEAGLPADAAWELRDAWRRVHARGGDGEWRMERRNRRLRVATVAGGRASAWSEEPFALVAARGALVSWNGRRYRGTLSFVATDTAILVVNRVALEDYLRGVVPAEIGSRSPNDAAAIEAQAVAARSYTAARMREASERAFDLTGVASDQVYAGVAAEHPLSDAAVAGTAGLVLLYEGRVVRAPYHSTCGGHTAAPSEVWQGERDPGYLAGVPDVDPASGRAWCERSPRFTWERSFDRRALDEAVVRHMRTVGAGMLVAGGSVRGARTERPTRSGRVGALVLETDGGPLVLRGNAMRFALRGVGGEILNSTYFSLEPVIGRDGRLSQLTLRGRGNGHGVGMCQWGAIGRARAGHDVRAILSAYYPGATLARLH